MWLLTAVFLLSAGCTNIRYPLGRPEPGLLRHASAAQSGQVFNLKEGERLAVHLPVLSGGGAWTLVARPDRRVLRPCEGGKREQLAFQPTSMKCFEAVGPGITSLKYVRRAGSETIGTPTEFALTVSVTYISP